MPLAKALGRRNLPMTKANTTQNCVGGHLELAEVEVITTTIGISTDINVDAAFRLLNFGHHTVAPRTLNLVVLMTTKRLIRIHLCAPS